MNRKAAARAFIVYSCTAQRAPDKSEGSFMDVERCLLIPPGLNHSVLAEAR